MKITKQEVEKAEQLIRDYKYQINTKVFKQKKCICCKTDINLLSNRMPDWDKQDNDWYDSGNIIQLHCGYGSSLDMQQFYLAICDDCVKQGLSQGLIENVIDIRKHVITLEK